LRTYRDGLRILAKIMMMYRALKPLQFYGTIALCLMALSVLLGIPVLVEYAHTGLVPRMPTALLAAAIMQLGFPQPGMWHHHRGRRRQPPGIEAHAVPAAVGSGADAHPATIGHLRRDE
jgi:hypothetical protein